MQPYSTIDFHHLATKNLWQPIVVSDGAIIGGGATIVPGCNVGEDAVLGAGSVLTKHLPPGEVWVGNPASYLCQEKSMRPSANSMIRSGFD